MNDLLKPDEMGTLLGLSRRKVSDLAARGLLEKAERGQYRLASIAKYVAHLRTVAAARGGETDVDLTAERARLARAQADKAEAQAAAMRGDLVEAAEVEREWSDVLRRVRAGVMAAPSRIRQRLPHLTVDDAAALDAELRDVLTEIANDQ